MAFYVVTAQLDDWEELPEPVGIFSTEEAAQAKVQELNEPRNAHCADGMKRKRGAHYHYDYYGPFAMDSVIRK
jgi:hypothetical protein